MVAPPPQLRRCTSWRATGVAQDSVDICETRDLFQARLSTLLRRLLREGWPEADASLVTALLGEIGNNSFDHNLGRWEDQPGCCLGSDAARSPALFWVLDRGVGMLASLGRVDPEIRTEQQAIDAAFARVLSGRAPERRGNGLKFVRSVINGHPERALWCRSGCGVAGFGGAPGSLSEVHPLLETDAPGVATIIAWVIDG
jgi:hypothetical protein